MLPIFLVLKYPFSSCMMRAGGDIQPSISSSSPTQLPPFGHFAGLGNLNSSYHSAAWSRRSLSAPKFNSLCLRITLWKA